jgi:eukaryotic-like serine/threonine-protein kinase
VPGDRLASPGVLRSALMSSEHPTQADEELGALLSTWAPHAGASLGATVRPETGGTLTRISPALRTEWPSLGGLPQLSIDLDARASGGAPAVQTVSDFALGESLGEGGMGRVFIARQRSLDRDVAVKTVHERLLDTHGRALIAEGVVTGRLEHPNITPVHAVGLDVAGRPVIVMKRIQGVSWSELLADPTHAAFGRLGPHANEPLRAHVEVLSSVCNALHFAHSRGVVHRDVKPENVMIGEFGEVYLVDWGVALDLRAPREPGGVCGTPGFLAPEMVYGDGLRIDERTDVYLLGATLHVLLTGRPRHDHTTLHDAVFSAYLSPPYDYAPGVPEELAALANRACARQPAGRPQSALEFRGALLEYVEHESSRLITREGERRLADLSHASEAERTELLTEARFAFAQALREWPDNAAAARGLDRCLGLMIERALAVDDLPTARALAAQRHTQDERWSAEFRRVEARIAERAHVDGAHPGHRRRALRRRARRRRLLPT